MSTDKAVLAERLEFDGAPYALAVYQYRRGQFAWEITSHATGRAVVVAPRGKRHHEHDPQSALIRARSWTRRFHASRTVVGDVGRKRRAR